MQKLYDIKVKYTTGGTASTTIIKAVKGTKVPLTVTPDKNYEVKEIKITDAKGVSTTITENYFVMPDSTVTVDVTFKKIVKQDVTTSNEVEKNEKLENILLESLKKDETFKDIMENNNVEIKIEVSDENINDSEKDEIADKSQKENITIGKYFDITITVKNKDTGATEGTLNKLTEKIKFKVEVPEDIRDVAEGFTRKYYIVKNHNGKIEFLDAVLSEDGKTLVFETDEFSTYALAYKDEKDAEQEEPKVEDNKKEEIVKPDVPKTGDNIVLYVVLAVIALVGIFMMKKINTKKIENNITNIK